MPEKITACYVRVSTSEQKKEGYSVEVQTRKLTEFCNFKEFKNIVFFTDEGKSGGYVAKRPKMLELLERLRKGEVQRIIMMSLSRIYRNLEEFLQLMKLLQEQNCEFISVTESLDTSSAQGRFFVKLMVLIYELERELAVQRTKEILEDLISQNLIVTRLPYGYAPIKKMIRGRIRVKEWVTVEKEVAMVVKCFKMALEGSKKTEIEEIVGLPYTSISDMLKNTAYLGIQRHGDVYYKANYTPIIDVETFLKVNPGLTDVVKKALSGDSP